MIKRQGRHQSWQPPLRTYPPRQWKITLFLCTPKYCGALSSDIASATYDSEKTQRLDTCEPDRVENEMRPPPWARPWALAQLTYALRRPCAP
ncbi:hypothetical protein TNCV_4311081 [Trichonephila clavipes]|nr:hypothetical protein TNCV_4311081 [Trichonephila clavipes]